MIIHAHAVDIAPSAVTSRVSVRFGVDVTSVAVNQMGYIAGTADGIVTVNSKPARREILLMDANSQDYRFVRRVWSMDNGHYMFTDLDPDKQYLIMARDYNKEFEPFAYDYVTPATDITPDAQHALRESWTK